MKCKILSCFVALALAVTISAQTKAPAKKSTGAATPARAAARFNRALLNPAALKAKAPEVYDVKFTTTKGDFVVKVTREWAPIGADRFYNLVKNGFFYGCSFYRAVPGFVYQFGLSSYPEVTRAWANATIKDDPVKQSNKPGYVTFAMGGPNTRTTEVFISLRDNSNLDKMEMKFAPFGQVTEGMDVVQQLYNGYGDIPEMGGRGPSPGSIASHGNAYLEKNFPKLDKIISAAIISPVASEAPAKAPAKP